MAYTDTTRKVTGSSAAAVSLDIVLNNTVAGNLVVVVCVANRAGGPASAPTITDGGNTWTKETSQWVDPTGVGISWSVLTTGGNRTINCSPNGVNTYAIAAFAHEFSGQHATPKSGTNVLSSGSSTTADTTAMTPADNDPLVVAAAGSVDGDTTFTENVGPGDTGWTLSNEQQTGASGATGSMVFKIISGAPGTPRAAWTLSPTRAWVTFIMAFKPSIDAAPAPIPATPLVGNLRW